MSDRDFSAGKSMEFELRFTDKEITAWGGMALMKRMLDHLGFDTALAACEPATTGQQSRLPSGTTDHPIHALGMVWRQPL